MIKIVKPALAPAILTSLGDKEIRKAFKAFRRNPKRFARKWKADPEIYAHPTVKAELIAAQNGKCCYCESKVQHVCPGDVEHYRPKLGFRQSDDDDLIRPGYFWLAYAWGNLLFSCENCNRRYKKNLFPVADQSKRAIVPLCDLSQETPMLINPVDEDPTSIISYRGDTPFPVNGDARGEETIKILGLKASEQLRSRRSDLLTKLKLVFQITQRVPNDMLHAECTALIKDAMAATGEYSSAVRAAVADNFKYI